MINDWATDYARDIVEGRIPACKWVKLMAERHMRDLVDPRFVFDRLEANRRIEWFAKLRHYKGAFKGKPFTLELWQKFIVASIFGWKLKSNGLRRYRYAFVKVPRKNGKTTFAAGIALSMLMYGGQRKANNEFEPEAGAEVYFVATKEDQAKIGWNDCKKIVKWSPGFGSRLTTRQKEISQEATDSVCRFLGADSDTLDGLNPSCAIKDEFHAWPDRELHDVIEDAYGARDQPLDFIISTEGTLRLGIFDEIDAHAKAILEGAGGKYEDESFFAACWELDDADDPFDEKSWHKANPNLGVSKSIEYVREQAGKARQMPGKLSTFLTKQLNRRTDIVSRWLSLDEWDGCDAALDLKALAGRPCVAGLDLARSKDMTALDLIFPDDVGGIDVLTYYWIPEDSIKERMKRDRVPYQLWVNEGLITLTDGNVTDFRKVQADIKALAAVYQITELAYDPMFAADMAVRLRDDDGLNVVEFSQTYSNYALPCKQLVRLILGKKIRHGGNKVLRWNAGNAVVRTGPSGNEMPDKAKSTGRIDGISALLMGLGRVVLSEGVAMGPGIAYPDPPVETPAA